MIEIVLIFLMLAVVVLVLIMIKKDNEQKQERSYLKYKLNKLDTDLALAKETRVQIKAENELDQKMLDMMKTMSYAEKVATTASVESFSQWLSHVLPAIWNKVKSYIADVWKKITSFFS